MHDHSSWSTFGLHVVRDPKAWWFQGIKPWKIATFHGLTSWSMAPTMTYTHLLTAEGKKIGATKRKALLNISAITAPALRPNSTVKNSSLWIVQPKNANTHKSQAAAKMQKLTILSMERTSTFVHRVSLILCTQFYFGIVLKLLSHNLSLTYSQHMWTLKWVILLDDHINILSMTERHPHDSRKSKMSTSRETTSCTWREENVTHKAINRQQLTDIHYYCSIPQQSIFLSWNSQSISEGTVGMPSKFHKWFFGFH